MTRPVNDWDTRPQGAAFPHTHRIGHTVAQAAATAEADPGATAGAGAACTCGRRVFGDCPCCPAARWVRSWAAYDQVLNRALSPHGSPPQIGHAGLEFVYRESLYREPHGPHEVSLVATCDGRVHIGQDWYPVFDRDAFRRDALDTLATHHPLGLRRNRLAWHWPPLLPRLRICFGCALTHGPTCTIGLCTHRRQARASMYAPEWWRRCAGTPCDQWPHTTPAHECSRGHAAKE